MHIFLDKFSKAMLRRNKGVSARVTTPSRVSNMIIANYIRNKQTYHSSMVDNMGDFIAGKLDQDTYLKKQKEIMRNTFTNAFKLGKYYGSGQLSDLDSNEKNFITYQVTKEMQFMTNFANDIANQSGHMNYSRRIKMYSDSLDSMFGFGKLVYMPEDITIIWQLGVTDKHCPDCLLFASQNPYTKKTLPGFPKSGNSRCLSNCLCHLKYYYGNNLVNSDYESVMLSGKNFNTKKVIPTEEEFSSLMKTREEFFFSYLMYQKTKDKSYKLAYQEKKRTVSEYVKKNNMYFPVDFEVASVTKDFKAFDSHPKFQYINTPLLFEKQDFVSFFLGNKQMYGKIVNVMGDNVYIKTIESLEYVVNPTRSIIYKEIP